jgi:hypothetical protein
MSNNTFSKSDFLTFFSLEPMSTHSANSVVEYNATTGVFVARAVPGNETSNTPVAGANSTAIGADKQKYTFFTFPSTAPFFIVTGIEWLNGAAVDGNTSAGVVQVNANPPTLAPVNLLAFAPEVAQTGTGVVQRNSRVSSQLIRGGTIVGAFIWTASATGEYGTTTVASGNNEKGLTYAADPQNVYTTSWTATTEEPYVKVYYRPVLGI